MRTERRGSDRVAMDTRVDLVVEGGPDFRDLRATSLSTRGLFVAATQPPALGARVKVGLRLGPDRILVRQSARIVWVREQADADGPAGAGLEFVDLDPEVAALLARLVTGTSAGSIGSGPHRPARPRARAGVRVYAFVAGAVVVLGGAVALLLVGRAEPVAPAPGAAPTVVPRAGRSSSLAARGEQRGTPVPDVEVAPVATAFEHIGCVDLGEEVVVTLEANGLLAPGSVSSSRMSEPPRFVLRVRGIDEPYRPLEVSSGSTLLERVRVGHHPEAEPPELHVVLDLTSDDVEAAAVRIGGGRVEVRLHPRTDGTTDTRTADSSVPPTGAATGASASSH